MEIVRRTLLLLVVALLAVAPLAPGASAASTAPDSQLAPVRQGYDLLMDHFVHPLDSSVLLGAAWQAVLADISGQNAARPSPATLSLSGDRERDWVAFQSQLSGLATGGADPTRLTRAALQAMARAAGEGHTVYMDQRRYAEHLAWSRGDFRYGGIGARIGGPEPTVVEVFEDGPAAQAGLLPGDVLTHIDKQPVNGRLLDEAIERVRGRAGTTVELTVRRPGQSDDVVLRVVRAEIELPVVRSRMQSEQVGYLQIRGFPDPSVVDQVQAALASFEAEGAQSLVLDLRGNSGGRMDVGTRLLSLFVSEGPLYQEVRRAGSSATVEALHSPQHVDLPLAVLIDRGTASMGEIFASAVLEHDAGWLVGETTSGNVAAAQVFALSDGSALQVTVMEILSGQGEHLNGVGVTPQLPVANSALELRDGHDAQLEAALGLFAAPELVPAADVDDAAHVGLTRAA